MNLSESDTGFGTYICIVIVIPKGWIRCHVHWIKSRPTWKYHGVSVSKWYPCTRPTKGCPIVVQRDLQTDCGKDHEGNEGDPEPCMKGLRNPSSSKSDVITRAWKSGLMHLYSWKDKTVPACILATRNAGDIWSINNKRNVRNYVDGRLENGWSVEYMEDGCHGASKHYMRPKFDVMTHMFCSIRQRFEAANSKLHNVPDFVTLLSNCIVVWMDGMVY